MISPPMPSEKGSILDWAKTVWRYLCAIAPRAGPGITLTETSQGTIISLTPLCDALQPGPFTPLFRAVQVGTTGDEYTYKVRVTPGEIVDHVTSTPGNALNYLECVNQFETDGTLHEFDIAEGQSVFVSLEVGADGSVVYRPTVGEVLGSPAISIGSQTTPSAHYVPPVGDDFYGATGNYAYKLANFNLDANGNFLIKEYLAGDHIPHYRDLPKIRKRSGEGEDIFHSYEPTANRYETYGLAPADATGQIPVTILKEGSVIKLGIPQSGVWDMLPSGATGSLWFQDASMSAPVEILRYLQGMITYPNGDWLLEHGSEGMIYIAKP